MLIASPLLLGIWFLLLPRTVPMWIVQIPLSVTDMVWKHELEAMDTRPRDQQLFTPIDRDPNYRDYQIEQMPGLTNLATPWNQPPPGRVQVIGLVMIALWLAAAFALKSCAVSVAQSTRASERAPTTAAP